MYQNIITVYPVQLLTMHHLIVNLADEKDGPTDGADEENPLGATVVLVRT